VDRALEEKLCVSPSSGRRIMGDLIGSKKVRVTRGDSAQAILILNFPQQLNTDEAE
jgi:hypothetical protein